MHAKNLHLPSQHYYTVAEIAEAWKVHPDRVYSMIDCGQLRPSALLPKSALPGNYPGPATHVLVQLGDFQNLDWTGLGADRSAPLVGAVQLFRPDHEVEDVVVLLDAHGVFVTRDCLVIAAAERARIECGAAEKSIRPDRWRSAMLVIAALAEEPLRECGGRQYSLANDLVAELSSRGIELSEQTVANLVNEARILVAARPEKIAA